MKLYGEISTTSQQCKIVLLNDSNQIHKKWHLPDPDEKTILALLAPYSDIIQGLAIASFSFRKKLIQRLMKSGYRVYLVNNKADLQPSMEGMLAYQLHINVSRRSDIGNPLLPWKWSTRKAQATQQISNPALR